MLELPVDFGSGEVAADDSPGPESMPETTKRPERAPRRVVVLRRLAAPPAREITEREEDDDDDDDPHESAEDAPPFDDTRSFRPFDPMRSGLQMTKRPERRHVGKQERLHPVQESGSAAMGEQLQTGDGLRCVWLLRVRDVEEADTTDLHDHPKVLPLIRWLPAAGSNSLRAAMIALRARPFLGHALRRRHLRDPVGTSIEQDKMDIAVAFSLKLGDLNDNSPHLTLKLGQSRLRGRVRLGERIHRRERCVLRVQVDRGCAARVTQRFLSPSKRTQPFSETFSTRAGAAVTATVARSALATVPVICRRLNWGN